MCTRVTLQKFTKLFMGICKRANQITPSQRNVLLRLGQRVTDGVVWGHECHWLGISEKPD